MPHWVVPSVAATKLIQLATSHLCICFSVVFIHTGYDDRDYNVKEGRDGDEDTCGGGRDVVQGSLVTRGPPRGAGSLQTTAGLPLYLTTIHSKSEQIGGDLLLSTEKLAEKVRTSGRQNFAINVRLS